MRSRDPILGWMLIVVTTAWMVTAIMTVLHEFPDWFGVMLGISSFVCGCLIVVSVWRDRL